MANIKEKLAEIVGKENVSDEASALERHAKDESFAAHMPPCCIVKPANADQVERIVKLANETKTTLVPVSSSGSHHKGDTVPSVPGSVIVDMSGMKRIININRQQRMAVVEPGVTYGELQAALADQGMELSLPLAPRAGKSVLASVLDMEPRLNALHQWNFIDPLRCTEVVWGDGNRMSTGDAGLNPLDLSKQWKAEKWQVSGTGPMMLDFYRLLTGSQGTMGIVTWASLKCEVKATTRKLYLVPADAIEKLVDFVYRIIRLRFSSDLMIMSGGYLASMLGDSSIEVAALARELPPWLALVGVAGFEILPEEKVKAQEEDISEIAQQFGLEMLPAVPGAKGGKVMSRIRDTVRKESWKATYKGAFQDIFFTSTLDKAPLFIDTMRKLANEVGFPADDIGVYLQPQNMGTSYHCEFCLPYRAEDRREAEVARRLFVKAGETMSAMGAYFLRPHGMWAALQLNKDAQSAELLKSLKGVFDPNDIMNTGKLAV
jgi:FAD/FMN-containing dehydrogenase